ncbi:recombinase family protein [Cellulomonas sp.]|uniref:recombinase family protein n=1 Tax=Cellulomonas sp. TaxID=40001 RepID=UPI001B22A35F|nr:recombinase family protein [Cellulomonas sp.]MBO9556725.1 recombinase family protein [Cellulomonas sp.]
MTRRLAAVPETPPRAVLYLRQSTHREESISLELQERAGREHCARHGYVVVDVLADPGISGRTWKRPAVQRALTMLEQHDADVVVLWRWSRLSRSRKDWALAVDRADVAGGRIESATEPNDVTAAGRFARGVMTELAAFESERIGEQWKDVHARRIDAGLPVNGRARFGYQVVDGQFVPDPDTAPVLVDLYRRYLDGDGLVALTRHLREVGQVSPYSGKPYTHRGIATLLDSGFGAGLLQVHGEHVAGAHDAVIDETTWRRYLRERSRRATVPPRLRGIAVSPLSGVARCTACGSRLALQRRQRGSDRMRCSTLECSARVSVMASRVEDVVLAWLPTVADQVAAEAVRTARTPDVTAARRRAEVVSADASAALTRLTLAHARGLVPEDSYTAARDELVAEQTRARATLDDLAETAKVVDGAEAAASALLEGWDRLPSARVSAILRELVTVWVTKNPAGGCDVVARGTWEE